MFLTRCVPRGWLVWKSSAKHLRPFWEGAYRRLFGHAAKLQKPLLWEAPACPCLEQGLGWEWPGKEVEFAASLWPGCQPGKASACVRWPGGRWGLTEKIPKPSLSQTMLLVRWRQTSLPDTRALSFYLGWWNCPPGRHKTTVLSS